MSVGKLVVELAASIAAFQSDLGKAAAVAETQARRIDRAFDSSLSGLKSKLLGLAGALGVGLSATGFASLIKGAIDAQEELALVGARAGLTGEQMSALSRAALLSHTSLEDIAQMSARLSKALIESGDSTSKSSIALKALGFSAADTARLLQNPLTAIHELAQRINELPEGGTKAALQLLLLGKSGGTTSAALNELSKQTELVTTRTQAQIDAAKEFNDKLGDMELRARDAKTALANALLPTLSEALEAFTKLTTGAGGAKDQIDALAKDGSIKEWAQDAVLFIATVAESLVFLGRAALAVGGSFQVVQAELRELMAASNAPSVKLTGALGFSKAEADAANAAYEAAIKERIRVTARADQQYLDLINKNAAFLSDAFKKQLAASEAAVGAPALQIGSADSFQRRLDQAAAKAKRIQGLIATSSKAGGAADDPTKKILEGVIKALDASIEREKEILAARADYLKDYFQDGNLTVAQYYDNLQKARDTELTNTLRFLDQKIEAERDFQRRSASATDRQDAENKIVGFQEQQAKLLRNAATLEEATARERNRAAQQYADQLDELNAKLLELSGNAAAAAAIRFDAQNRTFLNSLEAGDDEINKRRLASYRAQVVEREKLNAIEIKFANILGTVDVAQGRIDLQAQTGQLTEIGAINARAEAAQKRIADLTGELAKYAAVANDPTLAEGPIKDAAILRVQQMQLEIDRLAAQSDVLAGKFRDIFEGNVSTFLNDIIGKTKSVKQAFLDMGKSIEQQITSIATKNISETLFGKGGPLGGIPESLAKLFGGKGAGEATGAVALTSAGSTLTVAGTGLNVAAVALQGAAASIAASGASSAFSSVVGGAGWLSGFDLPGMAEGGAVSRGGWAMVGERGREIVNLPRGAQVIPNDQRGSRGGDTFHIAMSVMPGASRASAEQAAQETARAIQRARRIS